MAHTQPICPACHQPMKWVGRFTIETAQKEDEYDMVYYECRCNDRYTTASVDDDTVQGRV